MNRYHLHWFTDEIEVHASIALRSYESLEQLLRDQRTKQSREIWYSLFAFLAHVAMVSKLLGPGDRGNALRTHLDVGDESPLLERSARNNLEHIDERIDGWVARGEAKIIETLFDDRAGFEYILGRDGAVRRVLVEDAMISVSEDKDGNRIETALRPLRDDLTGLQDRCRHKLSHESPYTMISP